MARGDTIDITGMHTETYDALSELIHDHEHPVALQVNGFTPKQVNAPEAILQIASVSGMIAPAMGGWAPLWSERHSHSYDLSEEQVQACMGKRGPG